MNDATDTGRVVRDEIAPYDELSEDDVIALQVENRQLRRFGQALFVGLAWCWNGDCDHESVREQQKGALHDWKYEVLKGRA